MYHFLPLTLSLLRPPFLPSSLHFTLLSSLPLSYPFTLPHFSYCLLVSSPLLPSPLLSLPVILPPSFPSYSSSLPHSPTSPLLSFSYPRTHTHSRPPLTRTLPPSFSPPSLLPSHLPSNPPSRSPSLPPSHNLSRTSLSTGTGSDASNVLEYNPRCSVYAMLSKCSLLWAVCARSGEQKSGEERSEGSGEEE